MKGTQPYWCDEHDCPLALCDSTAEPSPAGWCDTHDRPASLCQPRRPAQMGSCEPDLFNEVPA